MRIALTGVTGFIGSAVAKRLVEAGHEVCGLVRDTSNWQAVQPFCHRLTFGDHADETVFHDFFAGCDCVIHNSVDWESIKGGFKQRGGFRKHLLNNLVGSLRLLELSAPRQFIFVSSIATHHDILPRWDGRPDEDHPLRPSTPYGAFKAAVEAHLWTECYERDRLTSAIRPCAVYGMDPKLDRTIGYPIVRQIDEDREFRKKGGGKFVHVDDVAASILALIGNEAGKGQAYNLVDCYARWGDLAQMAAEIMKIRPEIDLSSPVVPKNNFDVSKARGLDGVMLNRGHEGLRQHLEGLIAAMRKTQLIA